VLSQQKNVVDTNNIESRFIFVIAHIILLLGIVAATIEFLNARKIRRSIRMENMTEISIGLEGVALKTSLHGTILLAASIGFYFLYLKFVYPVIIG
jgi:hypothetical protein